MTQLVSVNEVVDSDSVAAKVELVFLDDASYELVGGGDAVNGY